VPGIGPATVARLSPHVTVNNSAINAAQATPATPNSLPLQSASVSAIAPISAGFGGVPTARPEPVAAPRATPAVAQAAPTAAVRPAPTGVKVPINTATAEQLETLPRVGPVMAKRIIEHRTKYGPFTSAERLLDVKGIGDKTLEDIRPFIIVP
jgi:competence protein ComEA